MPDNSFPINLGIQPSQISGLVFTPSQPFLPGDLTTVVQIAPVTSFGRTLFRWELQFDGYYDFNFGSALTSASPNVSWRFSDLALLHRNWDASGLTGVYELLIDNTQMFGDTIHPTAVQGSAVSLASQSNLTLSALGSIFFATDTGAQSDFFYFQNVKDGTSVLTIDQNHRFYDATGIKILDAQQPAIANAAVTLVDVIAKFNTLLAELRTHGLIAT